jgi:D-alanine-D-alanine ligase
MKKNVYVICGGPGNEHEVSLKSAKSILTSINKKDFFVNKVFLDKNGNWYLNNKLKNFESILKEMKNGFAWPIIHGEYGEDGELQKTLEINKINYFGTNSKVSKIAIDKYKTQRKLQQYNINFPKSKVVRKVTDVINFNFPVIVKPVNEGSSVGLYKLENLDEYKSTIKLILKKFDQVLVQECISGREFTCGVVRVKNKNLPLLPSEIILTKSSIFDYKAKYKKGNCIEITPAEISKEITKQIQNTALHAHLKLGCRDISRSDMILTSNNTLILLEVNTIPGMTKTSFIPQQLDASGIPLEQYVNMVLSQAFKEMGSKR